MLEAESFITIPGDQYIENIFISLIDIKVETLRITKDYIQITYSVINGHISIRLC
jgi:hypothetical protein